MKIYIIYRSAIHDEPIAIAPTWKEAEKMLKILLSHYHLQNMWIEEKTLENEAIEI